MGLRSPKLKESLNNAGGVNRLVPGGPGRYLLIPGLSALIFKRKNMAKLILVKDKPVPKVGKEIWSDANNMFSTSPDSKTESREYTEEELKKRRYRSAGKYR